MSAADVVAEAASLSGGSCRIVAAAKGRTDEDLRTVVALGVRDLGENRLQEHLARGEVEGATWHYLGRLQTNKCKEVAGRFSVVHSLTRPEEAAALAKGGEPDLLVQVNFGDEAKGGIAPDRLPALLDQVAEAAPGLAVTGLMTMPPFAPDPEESRRWFSALGELAARHLPGARLSMGTTQDWRVAIEEGAHWVRLGRGLFG